LIFIALRSDRNLTEKEGLVAVAVDLVVVCAVQTLVLAAKTFLGFSNNKIDTAKKAKKRFDI